jgi:hypothetical protein
MKENRADDAYLVACHDGTKKLCSREKTLLWPILESLGVERKKWEKFKYFPDQLVGLSISCVKERDREIKRLKKMLKDLQWEYAKVCQANMNFRGCPFDPREKT